MAWSNVALRGLGFFVVSLVPITVDHLIELTSFGEALDGALSTVFFTLLFTTGCALTRGRPTGPLGPEVIRGALVAAALWSSLWLGWSLALALAPELDAPWAFAAHCALTVLAGVLSSRLAGPAGAGSGLSAHSA